MVPIKFYGERIPFKKIFKYYVTHQYNDEDYIRFIENLLHITFQELNLLLTQTDGSLLK
jgi:hypothetical protein